MGRRWSRTAAPSVEARFVEKVDLSGGPSSCWLWLAASSSDTGYGSFHIEGVERGAHRVSWLLFRGEIPTGLHVLHHCDNPPCVNPAHLFLGTKGDNNRDASSKGRLAHGERHHHAKLTAAAVAEIRRLGPFLYQREIADLFGVRHNTISRILQGKLWRQERTA